jgi:hypothetical protein
MAESAYSATSLFLVLQSTSPMVAVDFDALLAADEGETGVELEQEARDVTDQGALDVVARASSPSPKKGDDVETRAIGQQVADQSDRSDITLRTVSCI